MLQYLFQNDKLKLREVGDFRFPKQDVILVYPGAGHIKEELSRTKVFDVELIDSILDESLILEFVEIIGTEKQDNNITKIIKKMIIKEKE